jgi:transposase
MELYSTSEAAKKLGIGLKTLARYIEQKRSLLHNFSKRERARITHGLKNK